MTENELIDGILHRDRKACQLLVERYREQVIRTAYHILGNMEDAEDLSQEIFIDILQSVQQFRRSSALGTWIYRVTVNRAINMERKKSRRSFIVRMTELIGRLAPDGTRETDTIASPVTDTQAEDRQILRLAIEGLPEKQRIAFILNKYDGLSYRQVADIMETGLPAVESLIHRARINLQKQLCHHFPEYNKT